jgi:hypothetical protein
LIFLHLFSNYSIFYLSGAFVESWILGSRQRTTGRPSIGQRSEPTHHPCFINPPTPTLLTRQAPPTLSHPLSLRRCPHSLPSPLSLSGATDLSTLPLFSLLFLPQPPAARPSSRGSSQTAPRSPPAGGPQPCLPPLQHPH